MWDPPHRVSLTHTHCLLYMHPIPWDIMTTVYYAICMPVTVSLAVIILLALYRLGAG